MSIQKQFSDPSGILRRWLIRRTLYALLCAIASGLISWASAHYLSGTTWELAGAACIGVAVLAIILSGFSMGRRTSSFILNRLANHAEACSKSMEAPSLPALSWPPHDRLLQAIDALARDRADRYKANRAEIRAWRKLADEAPGLEVFYDACGTLQWANKVAVKHFSEGSGKPGKLEAFIEQWIHPKDRAGLREHAEKAFQGHLRDHVEARILYGKDRYCWGLCRFSPRIDDAGRVQGVRLSVQDIQSRKDAETRLIEMVAALQRTQALKEHYLGRSSDERMRLSALLDIVKFGILFVDSDRRVTYFNQAALDIWGVEKREEFQDMHADAVLDLCKDKRVDDNAYREHIAEIRASKRRSEPYDVRLKDGRIVREQSTPVLSADGQQIIGQVWVFEDVTEALNAQQRLNEFVECDSLTKLLNRRRFHEEIERQFSEAMQRGLRLGLVCMSLDGFKDINERFGHRAGDEVLVRLTRELTPLLHHNEMLFRLGSDEFAILISSARRESVQRLAQNLIDKTASCHFEFGGQTLQIALSLGLAFAPDHASDNEGLVQAGHRALNRAKAEGRNRWFVAEAHAWNPADTISLDAMPDMFSGSANE